MKCLPHACTMAWHNFVLCSENTALFNLLKQFCVFVLTDLTGLRASTVCQLTDTHTRARAHTHILYTRADFTVNGSRRMGYPPLGLSFVYTSNPCLACRVPSMQF